jgi:hypothetical protein
MTDDERIAEFLAKKGATVIAPGLAYGVNAEADKLKSKAERERRAEADAERHAERYAEQVREAYHVGGSKARDEVMKRGRY